MAVSNLKAQFESQIQSTGDHEHHHPLPNNPTKRKQGSNEPSAKVAPAKLKKQISKTIKTSSSASPPLSPARSVRNKAKVSNDAQSKGHPSPESTRAGYSALADVLAQNQSPKSKRRHSHHASSSQEVNVGPPAVSSPSVQRKNSSQCSSNIEERARLGLSPGPVDTGRTVANGVTKKPLPIPTEKSPNRTPCKSEEDSDTAVSTESHVDSPDSKSKSPSSAMQSSRSEGDKPLPLSKGPKPKPPARPKPPLSAKPVPPAKPQLHAKPQVPAKPQPPAKPKTGNAAYKAKIHVVIPSSPQKQSSPEAPVLTPPPLVTGRVTSMPVSDLPSEPMSVSSLENKQAGSHTGSGGKVRSCSLPAASDEVDGGALQTATKTPPTKTPPLSRRKQEDDQSVVDPIEGDRAHENSLLSVKSQAVSTSSGEIGVGKRSTTDSGYQEEELEELIGEEEKKEPTKETEVWDSQKLEKARNKRKNIALELLDTERTYVSRLTLISQDFYEAVRQSSSKGSKALIPEPAINLIFLNINEIHNLNSQLLQDLEERMEKWSSHEQIGDVMASFAPFLKLYSRYTSGFEDAMKTLTEWMGKEKKFHTAVKEFEKRLGTGLGVTHYMLEPVQRIPRYKMLLTDYTKHLPPDSPEAPAAEKALAIIAEAADKSNERIKEMENSNQILTIQQSLSDYHSTLLLAHRKFVKKGILQKISKKGQTPRMFFLFSDVLLHTELTSPTSFRFKNELSLCEVKVEVPKVSLLKFAFQILGTNRSFILCASSEEERSEWLYALTSTISDDKEKRQSLRSERLLKVDRQGFGTHAPIMVPDQSVSMCQICLKEFTRTFRRHHCRACGRVVCGGCSSNKAYLEYLKKAERTCVECYSEWKLSCGDETDSPLSPPKKRNYAGPSVLLLDTSKTEVVMEGHVLEQEGKRWNRFWFMVDKDLALYKFKAHEDAKATETVPLPGYKIDSEKATRTIHLIHHSSKKKLNLTFRTESAEEFDRWVDVIDKATRLEIPEPMTRHPNSPANLLCPSVPIERGRSRSLTNILDEPKESLDDNSI